MVKRFRAVFGFGVFRLSGFQALGCLRVFRASLGFRVLGFWGLGF